MSYIPHHSSPNTTPKSAHRPALRLSLSAPGTAAVVAPAIPTPPPLPPSIKSAKKPPSSSSRRSHLSSSSSASTSSSQYNSLSFPKKGILKQSSSYGSLDSSAAASMLHNLHRLIETNRPPSAQKISSVGEENRSDSGRESDDLDDSSGRRRTSSLPPITVNKMRLPNQPPPVPPKSFNNHHSRGGSCNSSFDDSGICLTSSTTRDPFKKNIDFSFGLKTILNCY